MPPTTRRRVVPINQLNTDWKTLGRSAPAVRVLHLLAERDDELRELVHGAGGLGPRCTPYDLIRHMRRARSQLERERAAALVRLMLREVAADPLVARFLLQALLPGLITIAAKLRWGQGGDWQDADEFFSELLSTTWVVVTEWSGQDRAYAVLDLLSAVRCRLRRQLYRAKDLRQQQLQAGSQAGLPTIAPNETQLEQLARALITLRQEGMRSDDVEVLYGHHVMGYSISELALLAGRERRAMYARRDRGYRRIYA